MISSSSRSHVHLAREVHGIFTDALGMGLGFVFARIERGDQGIERVLGGLVQVGEHAAQLRGPVLHGALELAHAFRFHAQAAAPVEGVADGGPDVVQAERLQNVIERAGLHGAYGHADVFATGEKQHTRLGMAAGDFVQQRQTVHAGHADVGQHQVERRSGKGLQRLAAVRGDGGFETLHLQVTAKQGSDRSFVIYHQHPLPRARPRLQNTGELYTPQCAGRVRRALIYINESMHITRVTTAVLEANFDWVLIKVETDAGITGYGKGSSAPA